MKKIGTQARKEIESILGARVFLELVVQVRPNWRRNTTLVRQMDWHRQLEQIAASQEQQEEFSEPYPEQSQDQE